jgi:hypothetical protein
MGQCSSSSMSEIQTDLEKIAAINYHKRINMYHYAYHGPYHEYIELCRAQYELECIPKICHHGPNYRPQYDHHGRQIY